MKIRRFLGMGAAAAVALTLASASPSPAAPAPSETVAVQGTIRVVVVEPVREAADRTSASESRTTSPGGETRVFVVTAEGDALPVTGRAVEAAKPGDRFDGTLSVPAPLAHSSGDLGRLARQARAAKLAMPVATGAVASRAGASRASAASAPVRHTVDVIALAYKSQDLPSASAIDASLARLNTFWTDQSGGQISSIVRTEPIKRKVVTRSTADLCYGDPWTYGARQFGRQESDYDNPRSARHLMVLVGEGACEPSSSYATLGESINSGGMMVNRVDSKRPRIWDLIAFHELGHNLSLNHAGSRDCTAPIIDAESPLTPSSKCEDAEYGDTYDVMGNPGEAPNIAALNAPARAKLGSLPTADLRSVTEAGGKTQDFTVSPADATSGLRALAIRDPLTGEKIYVEYRYPTRIDKGAYYNTADYDETVGPGVRVLRSQSGSLTSTALGRWAASEAGGDPYRRLYWGTWNTMLTYNNAVSVQVLSQTSTGARVRVTFRTAPKKFTTVPTPGIKATPSGQPGWGSILEPTGANPSDFSPRPDYVVYQWRRDGVPIRYGETRLYGVTPDDIGHTLQVRAVAYRSGYKAASHTSAPVTVRNLNVTRLAGANRYETAVKISEAAYPPPAKTTTVYLATGAKFADALSAAPAAAKNKAPLLLVPSTGTVPEAVRSRIAALEPSRIIVVGGTSAVSDSVVAQVRSLRPAATVQRIAGPDRYATSRAVVGHAFAGSTPAHVYVATGRTFPDALAASGAAGAKGEPVILVDGLASGLNADTASLINTLRPTKAYITGGYGTVSAGIQSALSARYPTTRLSGPDRFATAVAINQAAFPGSNVPNHQWATGSDFPDALAGATLAATKNGPLYLVKKDCVPDEVAREAMRTKAQAIALLGGISTLRTSVRRLDVCFTGEGD